MQRTTHRITVVSEGLLFEGYRTPSAFVWREIELALPGRPVVACAAAPWPAAAPTAALVKSIHAWLRDANLSKEDKAVCRRRPAGMSRQQLARALPGYRKAGA